MFIVVNISNILISMPYLKRCAPNPEPLDCKILSAALKLFVEKGYHNVSVHEIQGTANVSIGSIYKYFDGKEGIAKSLYNHILGEIEGLVDAVIAVNDSPRAQCEAIITEFFNHTETHSDIIAYVFHAKHSEFLAELPPICDAAPFVKMQAIVQNGIDRGEFKAMDTRIATTGIFGGMARLIQQRLDGVILEPLALYAEQIFETIWGGVARTPALHNKLSSAARISDAL